MGNKNTSEAELVAQKELVDEREESQWKSHSSGILCFSFHVVAELAKLEEELEVIGFPFLMAGGKVAESPIRFVLKSLSWEPPPPHTHLEDLGPMEGLKRKRKRTI